MKGKGHPSQSGYKILLKLVKTKKRIAKHRANQIKNITGLEKKFIEILNELKIRYTFQYELGKKLFDFHLTDYNILIEADGDFYHSNPKKYSKPIYPVQKKSAINDKKKNKICEQHCVKLIRYWESDINDNPQLVIEDLIKQLKIVK